MTEPRPYLKTGDPVRCRFPSETEWSKGVVHMASGNGASLAVAFGETGIRGAPVIGLHPELGWTLILLWVEDHWQDVASGERCEVEAL